MTAIIGTPSEIQILEQKLATQENDLQRLVLLDHLSNHYTYTNIRRAQKLLTEQKEILQHHSQPDLQLNYHLNTAFIENQLYNFELAEDHFTDAIEILEDRGHANQLAEAYIDYSGTCMNLSQSEQAENYLGKASKLLKAFPDPKLEARLICRLGFLNLHNAMYLKAIELFLEADKRIHSLEKYLSLKDYYFIGLIYSGLGKVYEQNEELEKSVQAYLKVVNLCNEKGISTRLSWHYLNVGNGFMALNDLNSALFYLRKAISATDDISQRTRASAFANLGYCYFQKRKYREALELYERAELLYKTERNEADFNLANIESWRAELFNEVGKKKRSLKHYFSALDYSKKGADFKQLSGILKDIANFYSNIGDYKNAYDYQILYDKVAEKYLEQINKRKILELEVKYEAEKKEREAELLRLQATKLQLKALRAQMNPHFMYNALNSIQNFITSNEATSAAKYLAKFAKLMRQSLEYSEMEIISLEKELEFLEDYLTINEKLRFENNMSFKITVEDEIEEDILGVPTMIVQPYVENAIEHGIRTKKDGFIHLSFSLQDENMILCVVEDNGIGRQNAKEMQETDPVYQNHKSRGTTITEKRLELLHRSKKEKGVFVKTTDLIHSESKHAIGTRVEIQIPIVEIHIK
ncbi:MAG: histidine kinase [Saprospiraceae bacterium]|jgi:tetratricopeptide (TPR) repeat protein|nr:histidine kinase [Saprospiraceae bacterium]